MNRPVLVTGASGFVGAHLARDLIGEGIEVVALGGTREPPKLACSGAVLSTRLDLSNGTEVRELLLKTFPRAVIHCAALANTLRCEKDPKKSERDNVIGTSTLLECCSALPADLRPFYIYISSDMVFDAKEAPEGGFVETEQPLARSVYGRDKIKGEQLSLASGLSAVLLRLGLVYGEKIEHLEGFIQWFRQGFTSGELALFSDEYRTPVWTKDVTRVCSALLRNAQLLQAEASETSRIIHLGGSERLSRVEMGYAFADCFGLDPTCIRPMLRHEIPSPFPRPHDISLSSSRVRELLGIRMSGFREALQFMNVHSPD